MHFAFIFEQPQAGCVERVVMSGPWAQPVRNQQGQPMDAGAQAWAYLMQFGQALNQYGQPTLIFPQGSPVKCICTNPTGHTQPNVYCIQTTHPTVDRQQFNAPYSQPVGNGRSMAAPPIQTKGREGDAPAGMYSDLTDCALPNSSDSLLGEVDGLGGTYSDIDSRGLETVRSSNLTAPMPNSVAGR